MTVRSITAGPTPPSQANPSSFNTLADPFLSWLVGQLVTDLNNAISDMNSLSWLGTGSPAVVFALDAGAADAYTMAPALALEAYDPTKLYLFKAANANTGACTLAVSGLAAKAIVDASGTALTSGAIVAGQEVLLAYVASTDKFMMVGGGGVSFGVGTEGQVWTTVSGAGAWADPGGASAWNSGTVFTRVSDSSFTVTDNAANQEAFKVGRSIRYGENGTTWVYGVVESYTTGTVVLSGAPMTTSYDAYLEWSIIPSTTETIVFPGYAAAIADTAMAQNQLSTLLTHRGPKGFIVQMGAYARVGDSGSTTKPRFNMRRGSTATDRVFTDNSAAGLEVTAGATSYATTNTADPAKYTVNPGDIIECNTDANGANDDLTDLTVWYTVVRE